MDRLEPESAVWAAVDFYSFATVANRCKRSPCPFFTGDALPLRIVPFPRPGMMGIHRRANIDAHADASYHLENGKNNLFSPEKVLKATTEPVCYFCNVVWIVRRLQLHSTRDARHKEDGVQPLCRPCRCRYAAATIIPTRCCAKTPEYSNGICRYIAIRCRYTAPSIVSTSIVSTPPCALQHPYVFPTVLPPQISSIARSPFPPAAAPLRTV